MSEDWLTPTRRPGLTGAEKFTAGSEPEPGGATVRDFWAFALGDLRVNNARCYLAEFIVARAIGAQHARIEWDDVDVVTPDGVRVEVKAGGYLQAWRQRELSRIVFSSLKGRTWDDETGRAATATYNADVYVFAVQGATTHDLYDPLDLDQWRFWVLSAAVLRELGVDQFSLQRVRGMASELRLAELAMAVTAAALPLNSPRPPPNLP